MKATLWPLFAIASFTFRDVLRQPLFGIVLLAGLFAEALGPHVALFTVRGEDALLADFGLSTLLLALLVMTCFSASGVMRREIETRTTLVLFSKPVSRSLFLIGKLLGVAGALTLAAWTLALALLLAVRQGPIGAFAANLDAPATIASVGGPIVAILLSTASAAMGRRSFGASLASSSVITMTIGFVLVSALGPRGGFEAWGTRIDPLVVRAALLGWLAIFVLCAFAIAASVWVGRSGTFVLTVAFFVAGLVRSRLPAPWPSLLAFTPELEVFYVGELFYLRGGTLPFSYLAWAAIHSAAYATGYVVFGVFLFARRHLD